MARRNIKFNGKPKIDEKLWCPETKRHHKIINNKKEKKK